MTPSKYIKSQGLPSLAFVAREAGVLPRTFYNWYHDKNKLFEVVVAGVITKHLFPAPPWKVTCEDDVIVKVECSNVKTE